MFSNVSGLKLGENGIWEAAVKGVETVHIPIGYKANVTSALEAI
ncbi:hypothetical protein CES85_3673 (plasmid) [Ochrobactrum quorumnocens]|uniref:Uncharacterized protein n=1 Tax=Ochrobactrum quorumnocens TaxID=271865 RepID=A0A248UPU0_9HYPH|nr:hypothetical protein CES85_3673 [[Ochrobactrum] quorumnocens]